jgi:hypothetical protein
MLNHIKKILLLLLLMFSQLSFAQTYKAYPADNSETSNFYFEFLNLNKIPYYYNPKALNLLRGYEKRKDFKNAYLTLTNYVLNFGIQNFNRDYDLLWRWGQLAQMQDSLPTAKMIYRLLLRHYRTNSPKDKIYSFYDSLTVNNQENYVPIAYYYKLVEFRKKVDTLLPPVGVQLSMGKHINSRYADYGPALNDKDDLFFTSHRRLYRDTTKSENINKTPRKFAFEGGDTRTINEDIFLARRLPSGKLAEADTIPYDQAGTLEGSINSNFNEGSPHISRDGTILYFARCNSPDGFGNCDIYSAELQSDSSWRNVKNLGPNVNGNTWDSQPSLSHSGDTLYFASDRLSGFGNSDIYFTYRLEDGSWSKAQNMGPVINTRGSEVSPFMHPTFDVLYFSSQGQQPKFGKFDIYKSYKKNDIWQEPKNIGPLVNGYGDEYYFTIDYKSKFLFYARSDTSTKNVENLDLFSFPLPMEAQPTATTKLGGIVKDSVTGKAFTGIVSVIDLTERIEIAPRALRPNGTFEFELIRNHEYLVIITGEDFFRVERQFVLDGDTYIEVITPSLTLKKWAFASMEFKQGSADILNKSKPDLNKLRDFLIDHPSFKLKISGHTDSKGAAKDNVKLSQKRAESIKNYVIETSKNTIEDRRIEAIGYGSSRPIIPSEKTEEDRQMNRRVEFEVVKLVQ